MAHKKTQITTLPNGKQVEYTPGKHGSMVIRTMYPERTLKLGEGEPRMRAKTVYPKPRISTGATRG